MDNLRQIETETEEISKLVGRIRTLSDQKHLNNHEMEMHDLLYDLQIKLNLHYNEQRKEIIPHLISHGDDAVRTISSQYYTDINQTVYEFNDFMLNWDDTGLMKERSDEFVNLTRNVLAHLSKSMDIEKNKLLPLFKANF